MSGQNQNLEQRAASHSGLKGKMIIGLAALTTAAAAITATVLVPIKSEVRSTSTYLVDRVEHSQNGVGYTVVKTLEGEPNYGGAFVVYDLDPSLRNLKNGDTLTFLKVDEISLLGYRRPKKMEVELRHQERLR